MAAILHVLIKRIEVNIGHQRALYATYNVAKIGFEFVISVPRNALQTRYGELFGGRGKGFLPSRLVPGGSHDEAKGEETTKAEDSGLVRTQPIGTRRAGGSL
jgi:hypothetical protein